MKTSIRRILKGVAVVVILVFSTAVAIEYHNENVIVRNAQAIEAMGVPYPAELLRLQTPLLQTIQRVKSALGIL